MNKAKEYLSVRGITDDIIYDNAERMHSLECMLDEFAKEYATEAIKVDRVRVKDELKIIFKDESISTLACKEIDKLPIDLP